MNSAWIRELLDIYSDGGEWEDFLPTLVRINSILRRAMISVESDVLYEKILEEIKNVD